MTWAHPRRILWLLAVATMIPIIVLSWFGVRILGQDRDAERQRRREALEVAAGRIALDIERRLQHIEEQLDRGEGMWLAHAGPVSSSTFPLLYTPGAGTTPVLTLPALAAAESAEYRHADLPAAATAYRHLTQSPDRPVRGAALLGLGRVLRKAGDRSGALHAYEELERLDSMVAGQPAALVGMHARARLFEEAGDSARLRLAVVDLGRVLSAGGLPIDRPTFEVYRDLVQQWGGPPVSPAAVARTEGAIQLWQLWRAGNLSSRGRRILPHASGGLLAVWTGGPDRPVAWLAPPDDVNAALGPSWQTPSFSVSGRDADGRRIFGADSTGGLSLMPADTRLPFVLSVAPVGAQPDETGGRRAVLISSLSIAFLLMVAAAYGVYRATTRELILARQQRDFVSAVSHEFRTPLTSMRHLTDLLASRGTLSDDRRAHYYGLLAHETERLHRLVEGLLSFGRFEAAASGWRLEPLDAGALLTTLVDEFRGDPLSSGREITCEVDGHLPAILADQELLSRALWNLLENAAKYSEPLAPIRVFASRSGTSVHLGVGDRGVGIPPGETVRIFEAFARGADATRTRVRGVGIGLSLVKRIVEAHGGSVEVQSEPGRGSTFTLVIPCPES